jgi:hypothetical protein
VIYIAVIVFVFLFIWIILVYIRKSLWDTVHRNLLDLEDMYEGKVIRKSMLARPVFHGRFGNYNLTLNFSSEKGTNGRINYIDVSYDLNTKYSITIASKNWLEIQTKEEQKDYQLVDNKDGQSFLVRPASREEVKKLLNEKSFSEFIDEFSDLGYFFSGKTGILCEYLSENTAQSTKIENLKKRLELIVALAQAINK